MSRVLVVGGGLAGLTCANLLQKEGQDCVVLEASDAVGGRVRTDAVDGFLLDRGFQIFLTAYPEARELLDYDALDLKSFYPGALVRYKGKFHKLADPWTNPLDGLKTFISPVGKPADKLRIASVRQRARNMTLEEIFSQTDMSTISAIESMGFSESMIKGFLKPFFSGIFLENDLKTSRRMFDFVFRMLSLGANSVPSLGMQQIPEQLASKLKEGTVRFQSPVVEVHGKGVKLSGGEDVDGDVVVIATEEPIARRLLGDDRECVYHGTISMYFSCSTPPVEEPIVVINGEGEGLVNNLAVMSNVARTYAPPGKNLVCVSILGRSTRSDEELAEIVKKELSGWFGRAVDDWTLIKTYRIEYALPDQSPESKNGTDIACPDNVVLAGDYLTNGSINGAMASGRKAAEKARLLMKEKSLI